MTARAARSFGQGALVAAFTLYLSALGWSATEMGATLAAALGLGAALTLIVGPLSDKLGRRKFLLVYELFQALAALLALCTAWPPALVAGAVIGGFGRGANGSAGPFGPLEQAWLAQVLPANRRGAIFSANVALGFLGMALGALAAGGVAWLAPELGPVLMYRPLFALSLAGSVATFALLWGAREVRPAPAQLSHTTAEAHAARRAENRALVQLMGVNVLNGLGIGMVAPLMAYWFALRYQHGPGTIGPSMAAAFVMGALGSWLASRLAKQHGLIRPVVVMRGLGVLALLAIPLSPSFGLAAGIYALRAGLNQGTAGVRQALVAGLTGDSRRGLAATVQNVSIQIPRALGPLFAGVLLHAGMLRTPFFMAAVFQALYLLLYARFFGSYAAGGTE